MRKRNWNIILKSSSGLRLFASGVSTKKLEERLELARLLYFVQSEERNEKGGIVFVKIRAYNE